MTSPAGLEPNADQLLAARRIALGLARIAYLGDRAEVDTAWEAIPDPAASALLLAIGDAVSGPDPAATLADIAGHLHDLEWADDASTELLGVRVIGVGSMGAITRHVLEAMVGYDTVLPDVIVPNLSIARGLGYLGLRVEIGDIAAAETLLIPGIARHRYTVWTTKLLADAAVRALVNGARRISVVHPLARLDDERRARFRPPDSAVEVTA